MTAHHQIAHVMAKTRHQSDAYVWLVVLRGAFLALSFLVVAFFLAVFFAAVIFVTVFLDAGFFNANFLFSGLALVAPCGVVVVSNSYSDSETA